jgi:hypothetical protein
MARRDGDVSARGGVGSAGQREDDGRHAPQPATVDAAHHKDTILEALFDSLGCPDRIERSRLSRASDEVLYALAAASPAAIVVNWWDHASAPARLRDISSSIAEVFCDCPAETAASRFTSRSRHPGHHDGSRSPREVRESFDRLSTTSS